jgi:hypothetical protein
MSEKEILERLDRIIEQLEELTKIRILLEANDEYNKQKIERKEEEDSELESFWNEIYEEYKESLAYQVNNKKIDWGYQRRFFHFRSIPQTKTFIETKLREDGLI